MKLTEVAFSTHMIPLIPHPHVRAARGTLNEIVDSFYLALSKPLLVVMTCAQSDAPYRPIAKPAFWNYPFFRMALPVLRLTCDYLQVVIRVIRDISVFVMNDLTLSEWSSKFLGCPVSGGKHSSVSPGIWVSASCDGVSSHDSNLIKL